MKRFSVSDIHRLPFSGKGRYSVVVCKKLPQEQDHYFLCHLQAGNRVALLYSVYGMSASEA